MQRTRWIALPLMAALLLACNDDTGGAADTEAMCEGYGEDPDPCCCFPEPGVAACDEEQLCPTMEADCGEGTLGMGLCTLDPASDAAVMCALTALGDPSSQGSLDWTIRESNGTKVSSATLHLGGSRAALQVAVSDDLNQTDQAFAGALPSDFDASECAAFDTPGARFECMLNVTELQESLTCHDQTTQEPL